MVIRGDVKLNSSPNSGTGDPILTRDATSGVVGEVGAIDVSVYIPTTLSSGYIIVGNSSNIATGVAMSGDVTVNNTGVTSISAGVIVDADINASAAVALTKLATVTASRALTSDASGYITVSSVTSTELSYVSGVTSAIQTQLNNKQATITGGATTIVSSNLAVSRLLVSDGSGKVAVSTTTSTEAGYLSGVTSSIQTQFSGKQSAIQFEDEGVSIGTLGGVNSVDFVGAGVTATHSGGTVTVTIPGTANGLPTGGTTGQYLVKDSGTDFDASWDTLELSDITDVTATAAEVNILSGTTVDSTELNYLNGVTSNIQTQLDTKLTDSLSQNALWYGNASNQATQLSPGAEGQVLTSVGGVPTWVDSSVSGTYGFQGQAYAVWSGSGLIFDVYWPDYYINGVLYSSGSGQITLDPADATYDRLDVIAVDASGAVKLTGTATTDPVKATVDDLTQLEITTILVAAGATTPVAVTDENVYLENTEWVGTSSVPGATFGDTTDPFAGTTHVDIDSFTAGQYVQFVDGSTHDISDFNYLKFYVKLKATFASPAGFIISFKNGVTTTSSAFTVTNGIYAFDRTDTSGYQLIVVPLSEFTFTGATFDTVYFQLKGSNATGFRMDNVVLQGGISGASVEQNALVTISTPSGSAVATQANDTFVFAEGSNMTISAVGKTITFAATGGSGGHTIQDEGTPLTARANLNFVGSAVTVTDGGAGPDSTIVTISGGGSGTINTGNQYRLPYYSANPTGTTLSEAAAITAARILKSDANGVPTHTAYTEDDLAYWKTLPGTPTRVGNTSLTITDTANANLYNLKFGPLTILKWMDSGNVKMAMVINASYSSNTVTININGDDLASGFTDMRYTWEKARVEVFPYAGNVSDNNNVSRKWQSSGVSKLFSVRVLHGVAGTTNPTTYDLNINGTTCTTTKASVASGATDSGFYRVNDGTTIADGEVLSIDVDTQSTTQAIDFFYSVYWLPYYNYLL